MGKSPWLWKYWRLLLRGSLACQASALDRKQRALALQPSRKRRQRRRPSSRATCVCLREARYTLNYAYNI